MLEEIVPSAPAVELLAADAAAPLARLADHPVWRAALAGTLERDRLCRLVLRLHPVVAGTGRYLFSAKVSQISAADGEQLFRQLYQSDQDPDADADAGWRRVGRALGADDGDFDRVLRAPSPEAADLVDILRQHSLRSSAAAAVAVAWAIERQLPRLWGALADALAASYGAVEADLVHLRHEAARASQVEEWIAELVERYLTQAEPYALYETRRAVREVVWAWTALTESAR
jgi:hypothetical protein